MGELHQLIIRHGKQKAQELLGDVDRRILDTAADFLADEDCEIGVTFSGFCLVSLPHRRLDVNEIWVRNGNRVSLTLEPGTIPGTKRKVGVPYGAKARMMLLYLQGEAIRNNSPEVELGPSMHAWMRRMGVSLGGKSYHDLRDQMRRISLCHLTFSYEDDGRVEFTKDPIVKAGSVEAFDNTNPEQGRLWQETLRLGDTFYDMLKKHPVPLLESAIRALSSQSQALDIYIWLAYRLHVLERDTAISWEKLLAQFGAGYSRTRDFKRRFCLSLQQALAVYPEAEVKVTRGGIVLSPSAPPVPERSLLVARG